MPIKDADIVLMDETSIIHAVGTVKSDVVYVPKIKNHKGTEIKDRPNVSGRLFWNTVVSDDLLATAGAATLTIALYNHSAVDAVDSGVAILTAPAVVVAQTTTDKPAGTRICSMPLPSGQLEPYFEIAVGIADKNIEAGKLDSWIGNAIQEGE